jgi:predicted metal-dependent hydrolase
MASRIDLGGLPVEVVWKDIKNLHLSILPPEGKVRIAAPRHMNLDAIRVYAIAKLGWIKNQRRKMREQERETPREYLERESHHVWGRRYLLKRIERDTAPVVELGHGKLYLRVRPGTDAARCREILDAWYRGQIRATLPELLAKWEPRMNARVGRVFVQRMKTRWGSCNPASRAIRLNTDLAKKPVECLEYILVHEMAHLIEPTHNARFIALMDLFIPAWRHLRERLNELPVRHEEWMY